MKKSGEKGGTNLPILKSSKGSPSNTATNPRSRVNQMRTSDEIAKRVGLNLSPSSSASVPKRSKSPGNRQSLSPSRVPVFKGGVRYITDDMIKKQAKEENFNLITNLNLNISKDGKKIKYIENLEKLGKLQVLIISNNMIEKMEKMDKLLKLRELNLAYNMISKIDGLENLVLLQTLNLTGNQIEHIPVWLSKKLKALRIFRISRNKLESLSEVSKLKSLSDLSTFDISENPVSDISHHRLYIIFHLKPLETLDGQQILPNERSTAEERFAQDELGKLEQQLEEQETRNRHLEEIHNKSVHELSAKDASAAKSKLKDQQSGEKIKELEQELQVKENLLKKKTSDLTKASEKHYQLEQELAFFKIDAKFDSLGERPPASLDQSGDDSGLIGESPYIGKARYRSNQYAQESAIMSSPQKIVMSSLDTSSAMSSPPKGFTPVAGKLHQNVDNKLVEKQRELELADKKLKALMDDLEWTEKKLLRATADMKKMAQRETPDHFKGDGKFRMRQRLARKMSNVTQLRDMATQVESEIDRKQQKIEEDKRQLGRIQEQLGNLKKNTPEYNKKRSLMVDKEQQINESNEVYDDLQSQLDEMMENINRETQDIKKLEQQLRDDQIEKNEEMRQELDDVVSGLQGYIQNVKDQAEKQKKDCENLSGERDALQDKVKRLEQDLSILDAEATEIPQMQLKLQELENSFRAAQDQNRSLSEQLHSRRQLPVNHSGGERIEAAETEARNLRKTLVETERKADSEKKFLEKQLQLEKERNERANKKLKMSGSPDRDYRKVATQLEALKTQNTSLLDELDGYRHRSDTDPNTSFRPSDLKRRLKDLSKNLKSGKTPITPEGEEDYLGQTMKDLQNHMQDQLNKSMKEVERYKRENDKADIEMKNLKDQLKKNDTMALKRDAPKSSRNVSIMTGEDPEKRRLLEIIKHLERALKDAENRAREIRVVPKIVYSPGSESSDKASSLYSDEKELYDELQRELMDLKRFMKGKAADDEKRLVDAETEVAKWQSQLHNREEEFEAELEKQRQAADLLREKQEVRIQVIAEDLENAQREADLLQEILDTKDLQIQQDNNQVDLSNQMTTSQEEELARLYDILQSQRNEIEKLNQMLDHLAMHGPEGVGPGFDDELWRVRQEVNNLKETLAMQSAYVQTMPSNKPGVSFGTQADYIQPVTGAPMYSKNGPSTPRQPLGYDMPDATSSPNHPGRPLIGDSDRASAAQGSTGFIHPAASQTGLHPQNQGPGFVHPGFIPKDPTIQPIEMVTRPSVPRAQSHSHQAVSPPKHNRYPRDMMCAPNLPVEGSSPDWVPSGPIIPPPGAIPYPERDTHSRVEVPTFGQNFTLPPHPKKQPIDHMSQRKGTSNVSRPTSLPTKSASTPHQFRNMASGSQPRPIEEPIQSEQFYNNQIPVNFAAHPSNLPQSQPSNNYASHIPPNYSQSQHGIQTQTNPDTGFEKPTPQHNSRARRRLSMQSAFEPVYRPAPYNPIQYVLPPGVETSHMIPQEYFDRDMHTRGPPSYHHVPQTSSPVPVSYGPALQTQPSSIPPYIAPQPSVSYQPIPQPTTYSVPQQPNAYPQQPTAYPQQISDNYVLTRQADPPRYVHPVPGPVPIGNHYYSPTGSAQQVGYNSERVYYPAVGEYPARFYYPIKKGRRHRTKRHRSVSLTPVATGTPVKGSKSGSVPYVVFEESLIDPPSPIRRKSYRIVNQGPVMETSPTRGILKNGNMVMSPGDDDGDESYLFCNVTEHHELEDYIAELQEKLKSLKTKVHRFEEIEEKRCIEEDSRLIHRLQGELEERRDELEGLDLAIERQKRNLKGMQREEKALEKDRESAKVELKVIRKNNQKLSRKIQEREEEEEEYDEFMCKNKENMLKEEIACLEKTLTKRQGQLQEAERALRECRDNLKEAKEQARETIENYDLAKTNLQETVKETNEIEKRANLAGEDLVKMTEEVTVVKSDLRKITHERSQQEQILKEINKIIKKKDIEYKDLEIKIKTSTQSLQKLQVDLMSGSEREKTMVDTLRDSEDLLLKRKQELDRLRDQFNKVKSAMAKKLESQKTEVQGINQEMGKTRTHLQILLEDKDRKQSEFNQVLREADIQIANKHQELREEKDHLASIEQQKHELDIHIKSKRHEAQKLKENIQEEDEILQKLVNSVNKNKSELKHTYDMQQFELTELENLKVQRSQKMADLEKTQRSLVEEKSELEHLTTEVNRKNSEVDRLRQILDRDRTEVEKYTVEKNTLQDRMASLTREKDMMSDSCTNFEDKLNSMKRNHNTMEEKIDTTIRKLETLDNEVQQREKELEEYTKQKSGLTKEINSLKHHLKESRVELKTIQGNIGDAEDQLNTFDLDLRQKFHQRDEAKMEFDSLNDAIRKSRTLHEELLRQEHTKRQELDLLLRRLYDHDLQLKEAQENYVHLQQSTDQEEGRLKTLVNNANIELDSIRIDLTSKQQELNQTLDTVEHLKKESNQIKSNEEKFVELEKQIKELGMELEERNDEKTELANALTLSYEELQKVRKSNAEEQEQFVHERSILETTLQDIQLQLDFTKQDLSHIQERSDVQVNELLALATQHLDRANHLNNKLLDIRNSVDILNRIKPEDISEDKENKLILTTEPTVFRDKWKKEAMKDQLVQEQDYLRYQLRQQMLRHSESMEKTRLSSEETIDSLKRKLNNLQDVLFNTNDNPDLIVLEQLTRARSRSPSYRSRRRLTPSPVGRSPRSGHLYRSSIRSRSGSPHLPEREFL